MNKVLGFWLELGISGFRVDSLQFMIETIGTRARAKPVSYLQSLVEFMERRRGDAIFLGEANVSPEEQQRYFAIDDGDGVQMLFDFRTCAAQWLAHARGRAEPLIGALNQRPRIPEQAQFANFCRHHDELNIGMLSDREREEVFAAFAPEQRCASPWRCRTPGQHRPGDRARRLRIPLAAAARLNGLGPRASRQCLAAVLGRVALATRLRQDDAAAQSRAGGWMSPVVILAAR